MVTFEADPTQDGTLPLCFCHTSRLSFLPLVFRRALNRRAAFYSGISSAWAQRHLDSINWCLGIRVSFSGCKGEQKGLSSFGGSLGGSFFDREIKTTPNESFYQSKRRQKYLPGSFSGI